MVIKLEIHSAVYPFEINLESNSPKKCSEIFLN